MADLADLLEAALAIAGAAFIVSLVWMSRAFVEPPVFHPEEEPPPRWRLDG